MTTSAVTHALFLIIAFTMPDDATSLELDAHSAQDRFVHLALTDHRDAPDPIVPDQEEFASSTDSAARHSGSEGVAGAPDEPDVARGLAVRGANAREDLELSRASDAKIAASAGIAREITSLFATNDAAVGSEVLDALGRLDESEPGDARGTFGIGVRGRHPGGKGELPRGVGMGAIRTGGMKGSAKTCQMCDGDPRRVWGVGEKGTRTPPAELIAQRPEVTGSLDREIIQRVVRQHRRELKACYEPELQKNHRLSGEILVRFTISDSGDVVSAHVDAAASTLKNAAVERCVTARIRRWIFPRRDGVGMVMVRYPFRFNPG